MGWPALQLAGLLGPLPGPLSENPVFQVTPHTSLQLHGRTTELPGSDFNRQVICHARHTVRCRTIGIYLKLHLNQRPISPGPWLAATWIGFAPIRLCGLARPQL